MWLINCQTLVLEEYMDHTEAEYAILSHTWEKGEEVSYSEFRARGAKGKRGWKKIEKTCLLALNYGYDFAWIDTCCIDKTSSAELTEAINSMFPWYAGSKICYTYLADYDASEPHAEMAKSRWFTRGWTLQELIAPAQVRFYDKSWKSFGAKDALSEQLSSITGIEEEVLLASEHGRLEEILGQVLIARRMSWAANRRTTRTEDTAYCLLGIFGINLPLLYGEGERSFMRLQEEIVKNSNDLSLLAWLWPEDEAPMNRDRYCGVFAQHPRYFQASGNLALINDVIFTPDFTLTNKGLKIHTKLLYQSPKNLHILEINCHDPALAQETLAIYLKNKGAGVFARARPHQFASGDRHPTSMSRSFFLSKSITHETEKSLHWIHRYSFITPRYDYSGFIAARPEILWDKFTSRWITVGLQDFVGCLEYSLGRWDMYVEGRSQEDRVFVLFGYGYGHAPWVRTLSADLLLLETAIKDENWRLVALIATEYPDKPLNIIDHLSEMRKHIHVKLEREIQDGEPVYLININIEDRGDSTT